MRQRSGKLGLTSGLVIMALVLGTTPISRADDTAKIVGGILGILIDAAQASAQKKALKKWQGLDGAVIVCLRQLGIEPNDLIKGAVGPDDNRVRPYVERCQQAIEARRLQQVEEQNRRIAAYQEQLERERLAEENRRAEEARFAREQQERERAAREARRQELASRFPAPWVDRIMQGSIDKGWSREAVQAALGTPGKVVKTPDGSEMWTYGRRKVIFVGSKVSYYDA